LIDSLRPDHVGAYGYERKTSPNFDRWAQQAGLFRQAYTHGTQTRIAMASLFTGTLPTLHRIRKVNLGRDGSISDGLSPRLETWSGSLKAAGYDTWAFSANPNVSPSFGFSQGFAHWEYETADDPAPLVARFLKKWQARASTSPEQPVFAYVHLNGVHSPYFAPPPYDRAFPVPPARKVWASYHHNVTPEDLAYTLSQYDGAILYQDKLLGDLLAAWKAGAGKRPQLTIVLSDHGEEFLDHGGLGHGSTVYHELARVVLAIEAPGVKAGVDDEPVCENDVHRLVLDLAGARVPDLARGRPYAQWSSPPPPLYVESSEGIVGVRTGQYMLERPLDHPRRAVWYDRASDPREQTPRRDRDVLRALQAEIDRIAAADGVNADALGTPARASVNADTAERLKALGYVAIH
jgi:arylsulfatase A-like enzyme